MMDKLAYTLAGSGRPARLAQLVPGVLIDAESPAPMHPDAGVVLVTAAFANPWKAPLDVKEFRLQHVTMGEMKAVPVPDTLRVLPGAEWLDPAGFSLEPGASRKGRLAFALPKKVEVSLPCGLEATPSLGGPGRGGVKCVPVKDLEEAARKAAEKAAKAAAKSGA